MQQERINDNKTTEIIKRWTNNIEQTACQTDCRDGSGSLSVCMYLFISLIALVKYSLASQVFHTATTTLAWSPSERHEAIASF